MAKAVINGVPVEGTPEEIAKLLQLAKSQNVSQPTRMPQWVDRTGEKKEQKAGA